jgi:hypothetical protein
MACVHKRAHNGSLSIKADSEESQTKECRVEVLRDLARWFPARTFRAQHVEDLAHWLQQFERHRWTRSAILEARNNPVFVEYFGREWLKGYFGRTRPRKPWLIIARTIVGLLISALHDFDGKRRGIGAPDGPVIQFTHGYLVRLLGRDATPAPETLHRKLNEAARSSGRKPPEERWRRRQPPGRDSAQALGVRRQYFPRETAPIQRVQGRSLECIGLTLPC